MNYNKQITIEASSNIKTLGTNNQFQVNFPPLLVKKGTQISISGSIIEELGASNGQIIELQKENISKEKPYISSFQRLKINYYINNNGYKSVSVPFIFKNGYKVGVTGDLNLNLDSKHHVAQLSLQNAFNPLQITDMTGFVNVDYTGYNDRTFFNLINDWKFRKAGEAMPTSNLLTYLGQEIDSPASIRCAHKHLAPDSKKFILVDPSFKGYHETVELKEYSNEIDINLENSLLETPNEISYRINTALQTSESNTTDNLTFVKGIPHHQGDNLTNGDFLPIFNFSGKTMLNIPSNGQMPPELQAQGLYEHTFYSNMAVKDINRHKGGHLLLQTTNPNINNGVEGLDFSTWQPGCDLTDLFRNTATCFPKLRFYPLIMACCFDTTKEYLKFQDNLGNFIEFNNNDPFALGRYNFEIDTVVSDGSAVPAGFNYYIVFNAFVGAIDLRGLGRIEHDGTHGLKFVMYQVQDGVVPEVPVMPLVELGHFKFHTHPSEYLNGIFFNFTEAGGLTSAQFFNNAAALPTIELGKIYNGLPYVTFFESDSGGRLARVVGDSVDYYNHVNEFTAIPDKFLIPMNIQATEQNIKMISEFMRLNEIYIGDKTTYKEQQNDHLNWVVRLDTGLNDSYLSTKVIYPYVQDDATTYIKNTMNGSANFSFYGNWYPNLISQWNNKNRSNDIAGSFNKLFPLQVYPINSQSDMGSDKFSNYHYLWVYSRFDENIYNDVKTSNIDMTLSTHSPGGTLEQTTTYSLAGLKMEVDNDFKDLCKKYNVNLKSVNYHNVNNNGIGFINKYDTAGGTGDNLRVAEATLTAANYYGPFRICCGCNLGFDPSGIINPFIVPVNTDQTNNENTDVRRWKLNSYEPDDNNHAKYSSYIEDYVNYVFVGTTNPQINFNSDGRFEILNLHTPRLFSQGDSKTGVSVGSQVAIFNEKNQMFNVLRVFSDNPTQDPDLVKTESQNFGIADSICGIGIIGLSVKDESGTILKCDFDNFYDNTINYDGCLFHRLGFRLNQFLFTYGSQESRMNLFYQNDVNNNRLNYCSFFTTEGFLNQSINQLINVYSSNQPDNITGTNPINLRGLPEYKNGYVGLTQYALNVESFKVRALSLPARLVNSYYHIVTTLPTTSYIANNNFLDVGCYVFKQYRTGNFFFSYSSDMIATATEDFILTNIHTEIRNQNGTLAQNLGVNNTIFYKLSFPQTINQPNIPEPLSRTEEQLIRLNSNVKDLESITMKRNKKMIIGRNAQTILNQISQQNQILNTAYDPPIPIPNIANTFNIIPNSAPRFTITNPITGAQIISTTQPKSPLKQPEFNILETGPPQVVIPPVMIDDRTMNDARLNRLQLNVATQTLETKSEEKTGEYNVNIFNTMDVIEGAAAAGDIDTVTVDGAPVVVNVEEPTVSQMFLDLQEIQSGKKK